MKPFILLWRWNRVLSIRTAVGDVPRNFANYAPENYDRRFYGMMDATSALVKRERSPQCSGGGNCFLKIGIEKYYMLLKEKRN